MLTFLHIVHSKNRMEAWGLCSAEKKQGRYKKCGSYDDQSWRTTVRECSVHDTKLSTGGLNWIGNRQPKNWTKNNRLYGVKVKLSHKSEGLERLLFLQLIKEKLTNLGKFPPLNYHKILNSPSPSFEILVPSLPLQRRGTGEGAGGEETDNIAY